MRRQYTFIDAWQRAAGPNIDNPRAFAAYVAGAAAVLGLVARNCPPPSQTTAEEMLRCLLAELDAIGNDLAPHIEKGTRQ